MKKIYLALLALVLVAGATTTYILQASEAKRCTGSSRCTACKNCKYCKHCAKQGGRCGICR